MVKQLIFSSLKKLIAAELQFQAKNAKFIYAADKVKVNYLQAFIRAQAVLANPGASQQEVKAVLAEVKAAKKKLNGKKPKVVNAHNSHPFFERICDKSETPVSDLFFFTLE